MQVEVVSEWVARETNMKLDRGVQMLGLACVVALGVNDARAAYVNYVIGDGGLETFNITWDGTTENALVGGILMTQQYLVGPNHQAGMPESFSRSEEHTSELQSLRHLVCRLL